MFCNVRGEINKIEVPTKVLGDTGLLSPGGGGGGEGGGCAPRSDPLPFYISFLAEKVPLSYTFHWKIMKGPFKYLNDKFPYPPYPFIYLKHDKGTPFGRSLPV